MTKDEDSPHDVGPHNVVPVSTISSNYFPSRLPGEIRNTIYEHVMNNARPFFRPPTYWPLAYLSLENHDQQYELFLSSRRAFVSCLGLTSVNRQIRSEFGSLLMKEVYLAIPLFELSAFLATFFPPQCLEGSCGHNGHPTRPRNITVVLGPLQPENAVGRNMIDVYKVKTYVPDFKIGYFIRGLYGDRGQSSLGFLLSLQGLMANDTTAFLDDVRSGLIGSAVQKVSKSDPQIWWWKFGLRKSSGRLSKSDKDSMCSHVKWTTRDYNIEMCVQNNKGKLTEVWVYCHLSQTLVRQDQYVR